MTKLLIIIMFIIGSFSFLHAGKGHFIAVNSEQAKAINLTVAYAPKSGAYIFSASFKKKYGKYDTVTLSYNDGMTIRELELKDDQNERNNLVGIIRVSREAFKSATITIRYSSESIPARCPPTYLIRLSDLPIFKNK